MDTHSLPRGYTDRSERFVAPLSALNLYLRVCGRKFATSCALLKTWIGTFKIEARIAFAAVGGRDVIAEDGNFMEHNVL